ncbi:transglutaminase family protein [Alkalinema sp. FACHB-956]|uniref:transglutaminase family protein n=1 Tax=Alkalinema sp. FACHB-956 TaxID=2692768 RepID=UPI0016869033|nr:transglutaminase family protein [Alkalinema sp. FACHB-956]
MHYRIFHTTVYQYSKPVTLQPHLLRLRPRSDGWQTLHDFSVTVTPEPQAVSALSDLDGNALLKVWFDPSQSVEQLTIATQSHVETHQANPFVYLLEPWAIELPFDYPKSLWSQLQPYLGRAEGQASLDPVAVELAQEVDQAANGNITEFLHQLNQRIYTECQYTIRETGHPFAAGVTWRDKKGSCRDFAVLFMEVCRSVGLATRFVSGYQEGDPDSNDRHLHAWVEVYLPGAGWRGYDPTHGLVVGDRHIALVASAIPGHTAPVAGRVHCFGGAQSELSYQLKIHVSDQ